MGVVMRGLHSKAVPLAAILSVAAAGCSDARGGVQGPAETPDGGASDADAGGGDLAPGETDGAPLPDGAGVCPAGHATLTFRVNDSANATYGPGELIWTGSFSWDEATNVLTYATSWLPEEGPYPPLFDDGPISMGGHEREGEDAGDHAWSVAVCYLADQDRLLSFGLLNSDLRWIWEGPNGTLDVPAGTTGTIDAGTFEIGAHGDRDLKIFLDLDALHPDFAGTVSLETHSVYVKGTMNSWTPVQLLDDGERGDEAAGDGIVTYQHSLLLGPHDGLLSVLEVVQFVFVFAKGDTDPDDALEYKIDGDAALEGVSASGACSAGWTDLPVFAALDSKGVDMNAATQICQVDDVEPEAPPEPEPGAEPDAAPEPDPAEDPELLLVLPTSGPTTGGTAVTLQGSGFHPGLEVTFGGAPATAVEVASAGEMSCTTPAHAAGKVDVTVRDPATGAESTFAGGFTYVETSAAPSITKVSPDTGPTGGGTAVTIEGSNFAAGAVVLFGTATASGTSVAPDGLSITTISPPSPVGAVDVTVLHPDLQKAVAEVAFTYLPDVPDWGILDGPAAFETVAGLASAPLSARVYEPGATEGDGAGFSLAAEVGFGPEGSDPSEDEGWSWSPAAYAGESGNDDVWEGSVAPPEGTWSATFRFSVNAGAAWLYVDLTGAGDGFDPGALATVVAVPADGTHVTSIDPKSVWPPGGTSVTLYGAGLDESCEVEVDGSEVEVEPGEAAGTLAFVAPAHEAGPVEVAVSCDGGEDEIGLSYAATWDGVLDEWPASTLLAVNDVPTNWGAGNVLGALRAASDGVNLYVGIEGHAQGGEFGPNAVVAYVDRDLGEGTGLASMSAVTDTDGAVDSALGGVLTVGAAGFGAELAFAALDGDSWVPGAGGGDAGWRGLDPAGDLPWLLDGAVHSGPVAVEAILPLATVFGPPAGAPRKLGLVVRIGNQDGAFLSNQSLPSGTSGEGDVVSPNVATFELLY